jgi:hypothetical protein
LSELEWSILEIALTRAENRDRYKLTHLGYRDRKIVTRASLGKPLYIPEQSLARIIEDETRESEEKIADQ